jgi:iron complex transport system substrate-binding protein
VRNGDDLYHLDAGALRGLDPDLVVTQDLCAVCAIDVDTVGAALDHLGCSADVLTLDPHTLAEVLESIGTLGRATGTEERARELTAGLGERLASVVRWVAGERRPRTLLLEWTDPPFAPGHWVPEMVDLAGGHCVLGEPGQKSVRTTWDAVAACEPEIIVCAPCGYDLDGATKEAERLVADGVLPRDVPVWAVDANAAYARPGPRLVDGIEVLSHLLHPGLRGLPDEDRARRIR